MKPLGILAKDRTAYLQFLRESTLTTKQAIFVDSPQCVMALELSGVVTFGDWYRHPGAAELKFFAETRKR